MLKKYPTTVKLVFKNFPLRNHKMSRPASIAAWASGQQGKFWEMHDLIFKNYNQLSEEKLKDFAGQLGLNLEQWEKDRLNPDAGQLIQKDIGNGVEAGVRGTPTMFINGRRLKNRSLAGFSQIIDEELKKIKK